MHCLYTRKYTFLEPEAHDRVFVYTVWACLFISLHYIHNALKNILNNIYIMMPLLQCAPCQLVGTRFWFTVGTDSGGLFAGSQLCTEGLLVFSQNMITYEEDAIQKPYKALEHIADLLSYQRASSPKASHSKNTISCQFWRRKMW